MLPKITWGGEEFYDISGIVQPNRYTRPGTDGIAIHHTVGQTEFPDRNANGTNLDEMIAHVKAIDAYHVQQGYGGFGYNAIVFRDGTCMTVKQGEGARAHVAHQNDHLFGIAVAGTFTDQNVPLGAVLGVGRILAAIERNYGATVTKGHKSWVRPEHMAQWATACPGVKGEQYIGQMVLVKGAILAKANEALDQEVKRQITQALAENWSKANLDGLAAQIRWLTGGRLCP